MLGYLSEEELRNSGPALASGAESTPIFALTRFEQGVNGDREIELVRADGSTVEMRLWLRPVLGEDGDLERVEGVAEDLTERRALERKLLEAQRIETIGHLAGGVAHDFNNLLTVILAAAQLGMQTPLSEEEIQEHFKDIETAARSGSLVTRQLLMFARRDRNEPTLVDVNEALRNAHRLLRRLISERVTVELDLTPEPVVALMDRGRLDQVIINLAVNARDAMPEGGRLTFRTRVCSRGSELQIMVEDTGSGMADAVRRRAFEPFFTTKARGQGTGLGLAAVHGIVKDAEGQISIDSAPGHGTSVDIRLPIPTASIREPAPGQGLKRTGYARVLLVEDSEDVRRATTKLLESGGLEVVGADCGVAALAIARVATSPFDLVLTDVGLPDLSARTLVQQIRGLMPGVPVIFTSGYPDPLALDAVNAVRSEDVLLEKPFTLEELTGAVVAALSGRRR